MAKWQFLTPKAGVGHIVQKSAAVKRSWLPMNAIRSHESAIGGRLNVGLSALPSSLYLRTPYTSEAAHLAVCILLVQCGHLQLFRGPGGGRPRP